MKNPIKSSTSINFFTDEEAKYIKSLGFSEERIENINNAYALAETVSILPKDPKKLGEKMDKVLTGSPLDKMKTIFSLAQTDPMFFAQIMAYIDAFEAGQPSNSGKIEKVSTNAIKEMQKTPEQKQSEKLLGDVVEAFSKLTPQEKKLMVDFFNNKKNK